MSCQPVEVGWYRVGSALPYWRCWAVCRGCGATLVQAVSAPLAESVDTVEEIEQRMLDELHETEA